MEIMAYIVISLWYVKSLIVNLCWLYWIAGMSSLFSTLTFSALRLLIIKRKNNEWLQSCEFTWKETRALQIIWFLSLSFALPPFLGFGRYGKDFIGVRYDEFYMYINVALAII